MCVRVRAGQNVLMLPVFGYRGQYHTCYAGLYLSVPDARAIVRWNIFYISSNGFSLLIN